MKKICISSLIVALLLFNIFQLSWNQFAYNLFTDAVPTEKVAREVGKAVLVGAFGEGIADDLFEVIYDQNKKSWFVYARPEGLFLGSVPVTVIRKHDGKILKLYLT